MRLHLAPSDIERVVLDYTTREGNRTKYLPYQQWSLRLARHLVIVTLIRDVPQLVLVSFHVTSSLNAE